jgi:hypothetical protein
MRGYKWLGWSEWQPLRILCNNDFTDVGDGAGTYAIACKNLTVHRVRGQDKTGLLYVGESSSLRGRLESFAYDIECDKDTHVAGWRYNLVGLKRCAPVERLMVRWCNAKSKGKKGKQEARILECELLHAYVIEHCELPPLNYSLGRSLLKKLKWHLQGERA